MFLYDKRRHKQSQKTNSNPERVCLLNIPNNRELLYDKERLLCRVEIFRDMSSDLPMVSYQVDTRVVGQITYFSRYAR